MNNTTAMTKPWWVEAKDVKIDLYQVRIDLLIVPAICVVVNAGIMPTKQCIIFGSWYQKEFESRKNNNWVDIGDS